MIGWFVTKDIVLKPKKLRRILIQVLEIEVKTVQVEKIAPKLEQNEYSEYLAEYWVLVELKNKGSDFF